jgi:selenocysteine lyase/cysteine desulfurase
MLRREFLAGSVATAFSTDGLGETLRFLAASPLAPQEAKDNEHFWFQVQRAFAVDRSIINLNSGGVSPSPAVVHDAFKRHLDLSNSGPSYFMWRVQEPQRETVRARLARLFGADPEEIAITRNASEGLQTVQLGVDLKPGDEVLCTDQDYGRMILTFKQRARREGIVLKTFPVPVPCDDPAAVVAGYEKNINQKTKLILSCHVINLTGLILPVKEIAALGRARGIPVVIDGAHGFAHFPFKHADLDCDFYATSLHKWLFAPVGCGMLFVRRAKIPILWPLMAADEKQDADIRKFEEIGTHPAANALAIAEAVTFHEGLGAERKAARLQFLRDRWASRLAKLDRVKLLSSMKPGLGCGVATFAVDGLDPAKLAEHLWDKRRINVTPIDHPDVKGIRVSPSVWTQREEIDLFCEAVEAYIRK